MSIKEISTWAQTISKTWFEQFRKVVMSLGFLQSQGDHTLFYKHSANNKIVIFIVYVYDIILVRYGELEWFTLKKKLASAFQIKALENNVPMVQWLGHWTRLLRLKAVETLIEPKLKK